MPRPRTDPRLRRAMCNRLTRLLRTAYDDNWSQLSSRLGYANPSGVLSIKRGTAFPDIQRLYAISDWLIEGRYVPSVDWIVCGRGPAVVKLVRGRIAEGLSLSELAAKRVEKRKL